MGEAWRGVVREARRNWDWAAVSSTRVTVVRSLESSSARPRCTAQRSATPQGSNREGTEAAGPPHSLLLLLLHTALSF